MSLWICLSIMWSRNKDLFTCWTIILSAAGYSAKSDSAGSFNEAAYFGDSISHTTLMRNTTQFRDDKVGGEQVYTDKCRRSIIGGHSDFIVVVMDNNQRGQRIKQQHHGISNTFIVVTHSIAIRPSINTTKITLMALSISRANIIYIQQLIVSL